MDKPVKSKILKILSAIFEVIPRFVFMLGAAVYTGIWQHNLMAGWAVWFTLLALEGMIDRAASRGFLEVSSLLLGMVACATKHGEPIKHEVNVTHVTKKEDWEP